VTYTVYIGTYYMALWGNEILTVTIIITLCVENMSIQLSVYY